MNPFVCQHCGTIFETFEEVNNHQSACPDRLSPGLPENVTVNKKCRGCDKRFSVKMTRDQRDKLNRGQSIERLFPEYDSGIQELLRSGICGWCLDLIKQHSKGSIKPSRDFKKLEFYQVEALLDLLKETAEDTPEGLTHNEISARKRLEEIKAAMVAAKKKRSA